jgi:hypothetical protein
MLGKLSLRAKILVGLAIACAGYVVLMPDADQTIEPSRSAETAPAPHVIKGAADPRKPGSQKPSAPKGAAHLVNRIVSNPSAAALFAPHSWFTAPPPPPPAPPPPPPGPPPAPTAPPLPFAFMGSYKSDSGASTYFLTAGDRVYDVHVGDTLDNTYSVDAVKGGQMLLTYMPLKIQQSIAVGEE